MQLRMRVHALQSLNRDSGYVEPEQVFRPEALPFLKPVTYSDAEFGHRETTEGNVVSCQKPANGVSAPTVNPRIHPNTQSLVPNSIESEVPAEALRPVLRRLVQRGRH